MNRIFVFMLAAAIAAMTIGCGGTADNKAANPTPAADPNKPSADPTAEALLDLDKGMVAAFAKGDSRHFETALTDKFVSYVDGKVAGKADEVAMVAKIKCDVRSTSLTEPQLVKLDNDNFALVYKNTTDGDCTIGGKKTKIPSPTRAVSIWTRVEQQWKGSFHAETPIVGGAATATTVKEEPKPAETKKTEATDAASKEVSSRSASSKPSDADAAKIQTPAPPPVKSDNTETLNKLHNAGWTAFKDKNQAWFNDNLTLLAGVIDPMGGFTVGRDNLVKQWATEQQCEAVTTASFAESGSYAISPSIEILFGRGSADGKCGGQPNGPIYQAAVYVKEGDAWKLAFMSESPAK